MSIALLIDAAEFLERRERGKYDSIRHLISPTSGMKKFFKVKKKENFFVCPSDGKLRKITNEKQIWRCLNIYTQILYYQLFCKSV